MALSTAAKSALGLGTVGGVAGSAIGANYLLDKGPSISDLIKSKNPEKRLLDKNSSEEAWKAAWKAYREANKNKEKDIWSIEGWTTGASKDSEEAPDTFKQGCASRIRGSSKLYDEVISYCTRKTILADLVKESSGRALLAKESGGGSAAWKAVWTEYKKSDTTHTNGKDAWKIDTWSSIHSSENAPDTFMDKCKSNSEVEGHNPDSELYKQLLKYCTTEIKD
ncbi:hypothetical protein HF1_11170 [Mycoplasma haemofelis str. Langford 1]|uniref:Uncharacterized protein n=1 Tax=Mycoplasma haemofelis (strain Langford 1) TaxID=941640 RepID=E8ZJ04_MYCHL|nr:hypothetical protein [Mycoplasma haemofelis]CBY93125.1 hypothetical protein HF1_11170 [Mycoplasma haemofelis str. Langford 1]